jgi:class 3 adenylate cyclase
LDFLNKFITDLSLAIADAGGETHKYIGDEIIATWTLAAGLNEAACVRACFAAPTASPSAALPTSAILAAASIFAPGFIAVRTRSR